tara:strand:- start:193 stop:825 length:633 start_codon:yes stop_codon:yes gene_type:complete
MRIPINNIVQFILLQCKKQNIDESHSLGHALNVLDYSKKLYNEEVVNYPILMKQQHIIYTTALLHDICDSKYNENVYSSLNLIQDFLYDNKYLEQDVDIISNIIDGMSYHKVVNYGFPNVKEYQTSYHIVREADLLSGYEFNRAVLYGIHKRNQTYLDSFDESKDLYKTRMGTLISNNMFTTNSGKCYAENIFQEEKKKILNLESIINGF